MAHKFNQTLDAGTNWAQIVFCNLKPRHQCCSDETAAKTASNALSDDGGFTKAGTSGIDRRAVDSGARTADGAVWVSAGLS